LTKENRCDIVRYIRLKERRNRMTEEQQKAIAELNEGEEYLMYEVTIDEYTKYIMEYTTSMKDVIDNPDILIGQAICDGAFIYPNRLSNEPTTKFLGRVRYCDKHLYIKKGENMNEWKTLTIERIPEFLKSEVKVERLKTNNWNKLERFSKSSIIYDVVEPTVKAQYRYQIQPSEPLKSVRVTKNILEKLGYLLLTLEQKCDNKEFTTEMLSNMCGREVELLD
jgi:hypothetical protein